MTQAALNRDTTLGHTNRTKDTGRRPQGVRTGLAGALTVAMLLPGAVPALADVWTFETPSKNIQCTVGQEADALSDITCTIINRSGPPALPRPEDCRADWGHTFSMREKGPARLECTKTDTGRDGFDTADYGVTGEFGGFVCQSSRKGLKCNNRDGHGFFLSRAKQTLF
uniref:DUF6636 domain-containing protein n=1 Tax=Stappia sp. TaxID=1870903 RepID=UPI003BAD83FB